MRAGGGTGSGVPIVSLALHQEQDIVTARQRARHVANLLGFDAQDQVRIATAVSEIARNAFRYAAHGRIECSLEGQFAPQLLTFVVSDRGPGFAALDDVLAGRYRSRTGMGIGITGTRRLMDRFTIESVPGEGSVVTMSKLLPSTTPYVGPQRLAELVDALAAERPRDAVEEVQQQNRELLRALDELRRRQEELEQLNSELQDTNRGVVALYAELDEKADHLRRADEMKSRFLSNMSHEFRTPLNSMLALTRLLLDGHDGALPSEQLLQVSFIRKAAQDLFDLVNDLLDLAKVEAGKIVVRPTDFEVANLFGALRGMLKPLLGPEGVSLVFEEPAGVPTIYSDEAKVSQILRNFISNALKFTERGEVRVSAAYDRSADSVALSVSDTGIGIAPEDQERIFQEFTQVEHPVQRRVRGTGLGLPLSRKLAELLGGQLTLSSRLGVGSTFTVVIPAAYQAGAEEPIGSATALPEPEPGRVPVLIIDDASDSLLVYEAHLRGSAFQPVFARSVREARQALRDMWARPVAIVLDIVLRNEDTWRFLSELKTSDATGQVPVIVVSAVDDQQKGFALGADAYLVKPVDASSLLDVLRRLTDHAVAPSALLIDDDRATRYVLGRHLADDAWTVMEAEEGREGLRLARARRPSAIFLDLVMPGMSGTDVLAQLRADPTTRDIPVVIATSKRLDQSELDGLAAAAASVLPKDLLSVENAVAHVRQALRQAGFAPDSAG
jgi:signal transduction histidine kinase/CheY-like chemotaxis protein